MPIDAQPISASNTLGQLRWKQDAGKSLRGAYGSGSRSTHKRERKKAEALECEAKKSCNIVALFQRQRELNLHSPTVQDNPMPTLPIQSTPGPVVPRGGSTPPKKEELRAALEDLKNLLRRVSDQEKKYGERLNINGNFYLRHAMVRQFLELQLAEHTVGTRRDRAFSVAQGAGKGFAVGRRIVQWEKSWVDNRVIPRRASGGGRSSWMNDDDIAQSVRYFARQEGDSKLVCLHNYKFTNLCLIQELTSYKLVRHLKTIVHDRSSGDPITITSRTARKWLRKVGFSYGEVKKNVFVDGHERPDVVQDRNAFVRTLEMLAHYLVEFNEDGTIKDKVYPPGCEVWFRIAPNYSDYTQRSHLLSK